VSDIFREVEEDVRRERFEQLWKKYGDYIIAGAAVVVIAVACFQLWRIYDQRQRVKASDEYMAADQLLQAGQASDAQTAFAKLQETAPGGYAAIAKLQEADAMVTSGNTADAVLIYKQIAAGKDDILAAVARIHAGWAIVDSSPKSDVVSLIGPLTDSSSPWHSMAREILAYADYRAGATQAALQEYQALFNDPNAPSQLRVRCDVMATFIKAGGDKNYGTVPPPQPAPPSATQTPPQGAAGGPSPQ
jgi:hypothetical protein